MKVPDTEVEKYLKLFTFLPLEEVKSIVQAHFASPEKHVAQHRLASEVTEMVHEREFDVSLQNFAPIHLSDRRPSSNNYDKAGFRLKLLETKS